MHKENRITDSKITINNYFPGGCDQVGFASAAVPGVIFWSWKSRGKDMFHFDAFDIEVMGQAATFDVVTAYGLVCAAIFLAGFIIATRFEKRAQGIS